jgi:hypothetical protein
VPFELNCERRSSPNYVIALNIEFDLVPVKTNTGDNQPIIVMLYSYRDLLEQTCRAAY